MSVSMRLSRGGSKEAPHYKIVVSNSRAPARRQVPRAGGHHHYPLLAKDDANRVRLVEDRARYWLGVGAQPTDRVATCSTRPGSRNAPPPTTF